MSEKEKAKMRIAELMFNGLSRKRAKATAIVFIQREIDLCSYILQELAAIETRDCYITKRVQEELLSIKSEIENAMKRYLITTTVQHPFITDWFDSENHFNEEVGMVVYDLLSCTYTTDGITWNDIQEDHL
jgi:hypothetical protein